MSKRTQQTPEQKESYWLGRIVKKANTVFPPFIAQMEEIIKMANHGLSDENKRKLRILIANDLGRPLTKLEIKDETPPQPPVPPTTKSPGNAETGDSGADAPTTEDKGNQEHLRSSVLPDAGSTDDPRPIDANPSEQSGS